MKINPYGWANLYCGFDAHAKPATLAKDRSHTEQYITRLRFEQLYYDYQADALSFKQHYYVGKYIDVLA